MARDDESDLWNDDALVRALRAPGTPDELSDQARFAAAFREQRRGGSFGRLAGRFGIGATTVVTTIALSGGVAAAAYTNSLPDPVQRFAHGVLGPVGVPAAPPRKPAAGEPVAPPTTAMVKPGSTPTPTTGQPGVAGTPEPASLPTAPVVASPGPVLTPSPVTGSTPTPRRSAAALSAAASTNKVAYAGSVAVTGVLTAEDGLPLRNRVVRLAGRAAGQPWTRVAGGRTDAEGRITLSTPPLIRNTILRLATPEGLHSVVARVLVVPVLQASATPSGGTTTIAVTSQGGRQGDQVVAYRRQGDRLVKVASATLDSNGSATLTVPTPKRLVRLVLRLPATAQHARTQTGLTIGQRAQQTQADPAAQQSPENRMKRTPRAD